MTRRRCWTSWPKRRRWLIGPVGTTGYCMGGGLALNAAGRFPDQVGAAASFHGGRIATTAPDSPHLLAGSMKATVYVAGAENDASFDDEQFERLSKALTERRASTTPWSPIPPPTASPSRTIRPTTRPPRRATGRRWKRCTPRRSATRKRSEPAAGHLWSFSLSSTT